MTYKLLNDPLTGEPANMVVLDGEFYVPFAEDNTYYQRYLEWLAEGNEPLPADEPPAAE
jgi:hypothetical protein